MLRTLKCATSIKTASNAVLAQYERPADLSDTAKDKRATFRQTFFNKYAAEQPEPAAKVLYRVQVGAFSVKANVDAMLKKVKAAGFSDAFITRTTK